MNMNNYTIKSQEAVQSAVQLAAGKRSASHRNRSYVERRDRERREHHELYF